MIIIMLYVLTFSILLNVATLISLNSRNVSHSPNTNYNYTDVMLILMDKN